MFYLRTTQVRASYYLFRRRRGGNLVEARKGRRQLLLRAHQLGPAGLELLLQQDQRHEP